MSHMLLSRTRQCVQIRAACSPPVLSWTQGIKAMPEAPPVHILRSVHGQEFNVPGAAVLPSLLGMEMQCT